MHLTDAIDPVWVTNRIVCSCEETAMANRGKNQKKPKGFNKKVAPVVAPVTNNKGKSAASSRGKKR